MDQNDCNALMGKAFLPETKIHDLLASLAKVKTTLAAKIDQVRPARKILSDARKTLDAAILARCAEEHAAVEAAKANVDPSGYHYLETTRDALRAALEAKGHKFRKDD